MRSETKKKGQHMKNVNYKKLLNSLEEIKRAFDRAENYNLTDYAYENQSFVDKFYDMSNSIADEISYLESELEEKQNKNFGFKKEVISEGITAFTLDSKDFR
jgi:adenylosuccinate synthase